MDDYYTEDLSDFGYREIQMLNEILTAWIENRLPQGFEYSGVKPAMNKSNGNVFLVNKDYQVAMINGAELEIFHSLPYSGAEGFLSDLIAENEPDGLNSDDVEYIIHAAELSDFELSEAWLDYKTT